MPGSNDGYPDDAAPGERALHVPSPRGAPAKGRSSRHAVLCLQPGRRRRRRGARLEKRRIRRADSVLSPAPEPGTRLFASAVRGARRGRRVWGNDRGNEPRRGRAGRLGGAKRSRLDDVRGGGGYFRDGKLSGRAVRGRRAQVPARGGVRHEHGDPGRARAGVENRRVARRVLRRVLHSSSTRRRPRLFSTSPTRLRPTRRPRAPDAIVRARASTRGGR
mmetsp:Transcript_5907/g.24378  ORF Transcript_5907/g.24378 Transcript_5907/m.24378 type:complete len:219 (+) Transcript_5907:1588-2244(+)